VLSTYRPPARDRAADAHLGEIPVGLFSDSLYEACELVERYVSDHALDLARRLGAGPALAEGVSTEELVERLALSIEERPAIGWLLDRLSDAGHVDRAATATGDRYRAPRELPRPELSAIRALALEIEPSIRPTLALLDAAAASFPDVVAGRTTGEQALFSGGKMQLWLDYFHNADPIYALNNRIAATVAANRLPERAGLRVLEIGAGGGSAAEALLDELAARGRLADVAEYRLTEPNAFLRRRAARSLAGRFPGVPLADLAFDVDLDAAGQGLHEGRHDLVLAVNVLHVARDLAGALGRARRLLAPGGWLVAGECLRLFPRQTIAVELVFQQLRGFTRVALDPELRPAHGFLAPADWRRAFAAAGFDGVAVVPDLERIRDHHPRFFTGAIAGRRPSAGAPAAPTATD
jgi:SAM-dependent methyltransferase